MMPGCKRSYTTEVQVDTKAPFGIFAQQNYPDGWIDPVCLICRNKDENVTINNEIFSSNWELSVARATSVLRLLEESGTPSHRMAIEGFGQYYPSADNSTASGRAENRKVVIAISRYGYRPEQLSPEADAALEQQLRQVTQEDGSIQVIALPGGGIRITTRQENPDAVPQGQDPK